MRIRATLLACTWLAWLPALGQQSPASGVTNAAVVNNAAVAAPPDSRVEQIRAACIAGRRHVCGRVLQVTPSGLVVDSGYPVLLQPPLNHSWVTPANVAPARPAVLLEQNAPDSIAVGLVFLTDIPKRPSVHQYDYVALTGYPAGQHDYSPVAGITKTIRRFAGGLETAVALTMRVDAH